MLHILNHRRGKMGNEIGSIILLVLYSLRNHLDARFQISTNSLLPSTKTQITSIKVRVIASGTMVSSMSVVSFRASGLRQRAVLLARAMRVWSREHLLLAGTGAAVAAACLSALLWVRNNSSL